MRVLALSHLLAFAFILSTRGASSKVSRLRRVTTKEVNGDDQCVGTICAIDEDTDGCCPIDDAVCCEGTRYCVEQGESHLCPPPGTKKKQDEVGRNRASPTLLAVDAFDCDKECPSGCCMEAEWTCCSDSDFCASEEQYCPDNSAKLVAKANENRAKLLPLKPTS